MAALTPSEHDGATEQQQVHLAERQLLPVHEHIIMGLPPFWAVTSPDAAALRAHFYLSGYIVYYPCHRLQHGVILTIWCLSPSA